MTRNRVDPFGNIIETSARGAWMGNRGVIHNADRQISQVFKHKAWITCVLEFKGRRRTVMTPGRWTELFFLDEATAFAAGHRPCFECRREDALKFKSYWIEGNPERLFDMKTSVTKIDEILHGERINNVKSKITYQASAADLPDGTFISLDANPYLVRQNRLYPWTPFGYENDIALPKTELTVLTPVSIVNTFRAGYIPQMKEL